MKQFFSSKTKLFVSTLQAKWLKKVIVTSLIQLQTFFKVKNLDQICESIRSSVLKSFEFINNSYIIRVLGKKQYLVKQYSRTNDQPHFVCVRDTDVISCDNSYPKYNKERFCGHTIGGVTIKCKLIQKYATVLSKCQEITVTQIA